MYSFPENHRVHRIGWLRAAVLGANDGIISTASLIAGVAAAAPTSTQVLLTGVAGLVAGALSMASGEYVSVSSQADVETADRRREHQELHSASEAEHLELAQIYVNRGLEPSLAQEVARQLMARDALGAHARDELGLTETAEARPLQAAMASAFTFASGAALPLLVVLLAPFAWVVPSVALTATVSLAVLGIVGAQAGGANWFTPTLRVTAWGLLAMGFTAGVGKLFGTVI